MVQTQNTPRNDRILKSFSQRDFSIYHSFYHFSFGYTQELRVFKSNNPDPANEWTGWENIARLWLMLKYIQPFERAEVKVSNAAYGGSYDRTAYFGMDAELHQWPEDLATGRYDWFVRFEYYHHPSGSWVWSPIYGGPPILVDRTGPGIMSVSVAGCTATPVPTNLYWNTHDSPQFTWSAPSDPGCGVVSYYQVSQNGGAMSRIA